VIGLRAESMTVPTGFCRQVVSGPMKLQQISSLLILARLPGPRLVKILGL
jgi:hypothetical protein